MKVSREIIRYISKDEALDLTEDIFVQGWDNFMDYLRNNKLYDHIRALRNANLPELCWKRMAFNLCGITRKTGDEYEIELNINYLYSEDAHEFLKSTVLHELAHYICDVLFDDFEHDDLFVRVCNILGDSGERSGVYSSPTNEPVENFVKCKCGFCMNFSDEEFENIIAENSTCPRCNRTIKDLLPSSS